MPRHKARHPRRQVPDANAPPVTSAIDLTIERIIPGGFGLAHADGQTVMVPLSAPGDRLRVRIEKRSGRVSFARIVEVIEPGADRTAAPCRYFGVCGGCDFQQLDYPAQLRAKAAIIEDCFRRIARQDVGQVTVVPSPDPWNYRTRAEWQSDPERGALGYFERGSHRVVDVAECPILSVGLQSALISIRESISSELMPAGEIHAAEGDDGVALAPPLLTDSRALVKRRIGEFTYQFGAENFFQANVSILPAFIDAVVGNISGDVSPDATSGVAVDLYCGVGLFSLPLARRFEMVYGVEGDSAAVEVAEWNAADAGVKNVSFQAYAVDEWLSENASGLERIDLLVLDPPRSGAGAGVIDRIAAARPRRIVYVACDPATLARDTRQLLDRGYELGPVTGFDMFPQTHHVETVARFARIES